MKPRDIRQEAADHRDAAKLARKSGDTELADAHDAIAKDLSDTR